MASKFIPWIETADTTGSTTKNCLTQTEFNGSSDRSSGFKSNTPASAVNTNSGLRQANLVVSALMNVLLPYSSLDLTSSLDDVITGLRTCITPLFKYSGYNSLLMQTCTSNYSDAVLLGQQLTASLANQIVFGKYNRIASDYIFAIAYGTSSEPKNLLELTTAGLLKINQLLVQDNSNFNGVAQFNNETIFGNTARFNAQAEFVNVVQFDNETIFNDTINCRNISAAGSIVGSNFEANGDAKNATTADALNYMEFDLNFVSSTNNNAVYRISTELSYGDLICIRAQGCTPLLSTTDITVYAIVGNHTFSFNISRNVGHSSISITGYNGAIPTSTFDNGKVLVYGKRQR